MESMKAYRQFRYPEGAEVALGAVVLEPLREIIDNGQTLVSCQPWILEDGQGRITRRRPQDKELTETTKAGFKLKDCLLGLEDINFDITQY
jgi:hypothetical protein